MAFNPRNGIRAKNVYLSFCDSARSSADGTTLSTADANFTGRALDLFWGAYYGDLTLTALTYQLVDLGFDGTAATVAQNFGTQEDDVIVSVVTTVITLTTNTAMTVNAHRGEYVIIRKADGSKVYGRIVSNTASTITTDQDLSLFGVAAADSVALLAVPVGLTMSAWNRLDHVATSFSLEPPATEIDDQFFLGTSDAAGSQNKNADESPPSNMVGSVTVRGGSMDLLKMKYGLATVAPTGRTRYVLGSDASGSVSFVAIWSTSNADTDAVDHVTQSVYCHDIRITNIGLLDEVDSDGRAEATIGFEVEGNKVFAEVVDAQSDDTEVNA